MANDYKWLLIGSFAGASGWVKVKNICLSMKITNGRLKDSSMARRGNPYQV